MPSWFYRMTVAMVVIAILLPYPPVKYAIVAVFGIAFLSFYRTAPTRTLFVFTMGMPVLDLLPPFPVPGLNTETVIILALAVAASIVRKTEPHPSPPNPFVVPVAYYLLVLSVSGAYAYGTGMAMEYRGSAWVPLTGFDVFSVVKNKVFFVFLAPLAFRMVRTQAALRTLIRLMASTSILVAIHALWETRRVVLQGFMLERNRASGLVAGQPNLFGGFLAMMIVIFVSALLSQVETRAERWLYAVAVVSCSGALLMTLSRGSWLALLLTLGFLAFTKGARMIVLLLVVALSSPLWLPQKVLERVNHTFEGHHSSEEQEFEDSAQVRVDQWKAAPDMMAEAPIIGHGLMMFPQVWERFGPDHEPKSAHTTLVNLAVEQGIIGVLAYFILLGSLGLAALRLWRRSTNRWERDLATGFLGAVLCLALLDTSGTRFHNREVMAYIWILGGGIARLAVETQRSRLRASNSVPRPASKAQNQLDTRDAQT